MKFDIVRAWKDETYRQSLSQEQLDMMPANPVGELELTSADLESVCGGDGVGPMGAGGPALAPIGGPIGGAHAGALAVANRSSFQSLALTCNDTVFSVTVTSGFSFLSPVTTFCIDDSHHCN